MISRFQGRFQISFQEAKFQEFRNFEISFCHPYLEDSKQTLQTPQTKQHLSWRGVNFSLLHLAVAAAALHASWRSIWGRRDRQASTVRFSSGISTIAYHHAVASNLIGYQGLQ
jgi:hypothetical protein